MITFVLHHDLNVLANVMIAQTEQFVAQTHEDTQMGQYMRSRLDTLRRCRVYLLAATVGDPVDELKDSLSVIRDEALSQIDGSESITVVAAYNAVNEFWSLLG